MVVGIRSALIVYSPSSHVKENLLRRPDEWGPFIFSTLKEKKSQHRKVKCGALESFHGGEAGLPGL